MFWYNLRHGEILDNRVLALYSIMAVLLTPVAIALLWRYLDWVMPFLMGWK